MVNLFNMVDKNIFSQFMVTCVKNTDGEDISGHVPHIPVINGEELMLGKSYEARHSRIENHLEILLNETIVAILTKDWFILPNFNN